MTENSRITVGVIYGGRSTEHSVSCISAGAIMSHLPDEYEVVPVGITKEGAWVRGSLDPVAGSTLPVVTGTEEVALSLNPQRKGELYDVATGTTYATVDVVLPILHGPYGEDGTMQGLLEIAGIPYVGPGVLASAAGMDKEYTKKLMVAANLPVTTEVVLNSPRTLTEAEKAELGLPVFVKPARGGSSIGISKVSSWSSIESAVSLAFEHDSKAIVEKMIHGIEVEVGVLEYPDGSLQASVPAQLNGTEDSAEGFYGFETKYLDDTVTATIPAQLPEATIELLKDQALTTFRALDCKGLARVDFFVTDEGPMLNEVNTMPGFTPISMYPQVFAHDGIEYPQLLSILLKTALGS